MAVEVKRICCQVAGFCVVLALAVSPLPVRAVEIEPPMPGAMLCTDEMVTDPDTDDLEAIPVAVQVDGGCVVPDGPVGI